MKMKQNLSAFIKLILAVIRPLNNIIQEHDRWAEELYSRRKLFALITPEWKTFILVECSKQNISSWYMKREQLFHGAR